VLPADLVDDVMAKGHVSKCSGRSRFFVSLLPKEPLDVLTDFQVIGIGFAVDQVCPIEVALGCPLSSGERAENDKARVFGGEFSDPG